MPVPTRGRNSLRLGAAVVCLLTGCGALSTEEQMLLRFFQSSRLYDRAALSKVAVVEFNPVIDGIVQDFVVAAVESSGETRVIQVDAEVRRRSGSNRERLVVKMVRRNGRWLITGVTRPRASRTEPAASSGPPY